MSLNGASLLALIGTLLVTILLVAGLVTDILNVMQGLIPAMKMLSSLVYTFAALCVTIFFFVFYRKQS
jgi:hypothetical protein